MQQVALRDAHGKQSQGLAQGKMHNTVVLTKHLSPGVTGSRILEYPKLLAFPLLDKWWQIRSCGTKWSINCSSFRAPAAASLGK